jgi:hypothetical protein
MVLKWVSVEHRGQGNYVMNINLKIPLQYVIYNHMITEVVRCESRTLSDSLYTDITGLNPAQRIDVCTQFSFVSWMLRP